MLVCLIVYSFLFPYISSDKNQKKIHKAKALCVFVVRCLMVYDVYLLCELYPLSLKIFIFASLEKKKKRCAK